MRYWTEVEKVCFVVTLTLSGAALFVVLLQVGGDGPTWWYLVPFAIPAVVAVVVAIRNRRLATSILVGALIGAGAVLVGMFALLAMMMTS
ncbi:hypothetical protein CFH99_02380 [Nocardioides aromaticivorans]|uniref:Uncharacterized protein n=1 Tax=Nocardioides aromaticivorans TaxID=200618 RepID=A0ABX7PF96_9ACTN|nr:hypothetical protein [Nocardioides aromaticivorans]QSR24465.1 hypothetical protein CFH99_02380 [Nocardioides aromaticivorans]